MNVNIVAIDPSIISTGLVINGKVFSIVAEHLVKTKTGKMKKWFEHVDDYCDIIEIDISYQGIKKYSELETTKLKTFQSTVKIITDLVDKHTDSTYNTICLIEGYSYSSAAGPLIDLVGFGTLVRQAMDSRGDLVVLAPTSLKLAAAKLTYPVVQKGKKVECRNYNGVAGGGFSKHDMYRALTEMTYRWSRWQDLLKLHEDEVMSTSSVPKPIEDLNDSFLLYYVADQMFKTQCDFDSKKTIENLRLI